MSTARCNFYQYYDNTAEPLPKDFGLGHDAVAMETPAGSNFRSRGHKLSIFF